jgi:hypothetical protein
MTDIQIPSLSRSLLYLVLAGLVWAVPLSAQSKAVYEIYGIRYATLKEFSVAGLVAGADKTRKMDIAMMIWLI